MDYSTKIKETMAENNIEQITDEIISKFGITEGMNEEVDNLLKIVRESTIDILQQLDIKQDDEMAIWKANDGMVMATTKNKKKR